MRKVPFEKGEFYHIYNRGTDKRNIFGDEWDFHRFFQSILEFNTVEPIGSIFENSFKNSKNRSLGHPMSKLDKRLVNIICYSVSPNHYHFILEPLVDKGIEKFMQKLGNGYTKYFNHKYKRSGVLFQGKFKSTHINSNEYLLHLSVYVNLNNLVHKLGLRHPMSKSSWEEYIKSGEVGLCKNKEIILGQFRSKKEYKDFAEEVVRGMIERKNILKDMGSYLLEN
ncbi:MAG: transposase [Parcubacteria group bacterium]